MELVEACTREPDVLAVVAIGSAIRDVPHSADVDLVLIHRAKPIEVRSPIEVDLHQYEAGDIDRLALGGHDLLGWALRMGRVVAERGCFWTDLASRLRDKLPWPDAEVARERAERVRVLLDYAVEVGDRDAETEQRVSYLTHLARAALLDRHVFPASRPEIPNQLREVGANDLADELSEALRTRTEWSLEPVLSRSPKRRDGRRPAR
jgi:hypothetical protein